MIFCVTIPLDTLQLAFQNSSSQHPFPLLSLPSSGWDVVMAAAMGAEEYGFGTIAMIAEGCIMARICHTNKCPVGIATQNEALRKRFPGQPDNIVTFFGYVAEEVRHVLAQLGYSSLSEIIGRPGR